MLHHLYTTVGWFVHRHQEDLSRTLFLGNRASDNPASDNPASDNPASDYLIKKYLKTFTAE